MSDNVEKFYFSGNGRVPNSRFPTLVYRGISTGSVLDMEELIRANDWHPTWHNSMGMIPNHHFHAEAHEIIVINSGELDCQLGGHDGARTTLRAGDAVVIPAGVGHLGVGFTEDLRVTGGFPAGYCFLDFRLGYADEYYELAERASLIPVPAKDPFFGAQGHLPKIWNAAAVASNYRI